MFNKFGEFLEINSSNIQSTESVLAEIGEDYINERFKKFASELKRIAPKANDFLYFTAIMMHAAEANLINSDGSPKLNKDGKPIKANWDISPNGSWKWVSDDESIKPYKNCFIPGTQILMEDGTSKNIEDIRQGDYVISHTGQVRKVLRTFETPHNGKMIEMSIRNGRSIICTDNHPFYRLNVTSGNNKSTPKKILGSIKSAKKEYEFIQASDLNKYDILLSPTFKEREKTELSLDQARLLGLFAAEGSYTKKYNKYQGLRFTYNINEYTTLAQLTKNLFISAFPKASVNIHKEPGNTCCVYVTGYGITDFFYKHVGEYSLHKILSEDLLYAPRNIKMQFITGWLEGDGHVEKEHGQIIGLTVSSNMSCQIRQMLNSSGILHSLRKVLNSENEPKIINKDYNATLASDIYRIEIPATFGAELVELSNTLNFTNRGEDKWQNVFYDNYALYTINDKSEIDYTGNVYNFEVEIDNSYVANDLIVHNCNGDIFPETELLKAYKNWIGKPLCLDHKSDSVDAIRGIILDTYYDRTHKRITALCALDAKSYPELANGVRSGYKTNVSMGVRVARAICTDCGQVATAEREFCSHMRSKNGFGEINTGLDPIELSIVVSGADPQAKIRTILAAANNLRASLEVKEQEIRKLSVSQHSLDKFKELENDLKSIADKLAELKTSLEKEDENSVNDDSTHPTNMNAVPELKNNLDANEKTASNNNALRSELQELTNSVNYKFKDMEKSLATLSHTIKEEIMSVNSKNGVNKEGYFQGAGGVNEPTPNQVKYPKDPLNEKLRESGDKHMVGVDNMGSVNDMVPGDKEKKQLVQRAEIEERAMRRAAALQKAKETLMKSKEAYWQGGGEGNQPTPGKATYPKDPLNEKDREKEDKQMVGKKPFPGVGDVDGLYGEDKKKKELLQRASLKAKFIRVAAEDGTQDLGQSGWEVKRDDEVLFTATVDEISGGNVESLYDVIASKEFATKMLEKVYKLGTEKASSLYKGAQAAPTMEQAPMAAEPVAAPMPDMGAGTAPAAPSMEHLPADKEGDPKEVALKLAEEMRDRASDLLEAVRVLTGEQSEMGELEGLSEKAASKELKSLVKMKKTLNVSLVGGMKKAIAELNEHQEEMGLISDILSDDSHNSDYTNTIVEEAFVDGKNVLADVRNLMVAFVKYARGSEQLTKRAQMIESDNDASKVEDLSFDQEPDMFDPDGLDLSVDPEELDEEDTGMVADQDVDMDEDMNQVMMDVDPASLQGKKVEIKTASDLSTKEARAELRAKLAAESVAFSPMLDAANRLADGQTQLDVKPSDDLGLVETLEEKHKKMMDVAEAPPKVRKEAARLNELILSKKVATADLDALVAQGLDAEVVKYWKQFYGEMGKEGAQFAAELLKEHAKAQVDEAVNTFKVKISRAYELTNEMVRRGLVADERSAITAQVDDILNYNDEGFEAMKRVVNKHPLRKSASFPQVGVIGSGEQDSQVKSELSLQEALDAAFGGRRY